MTAGALTVLQSALARGAPANPGPAGSLATPLWDMQLGGVVSMSATAGTLLQASSQETLALLASKLRLEKSRHPVDLPSCNRAHVAAVFGSHCALLPAGLPSPVYIPPWLRQRPSLIACAMHGPPVRVFAPHLRLRPSAPPSRFTPRPNL